MQNPGVVAVEDGAIVDFWAIGSHAQSYLQSWLEVKIINREGHMMQIYVI